MPRGAGFRPVPRNLCIGASLTWGSSTAKSCGLSCAPAVVVADGAERAATAWRTARKHQHNRQVSSSFASVIRDAGPCAYPVVECRRASCSAKRRGSRLLQGFSG